MIVIHFLATGRGWHQDKEVQDLSSFLVYTNNLPCSLFHLIYYLLLNIIYAGYLNAFFWQSIPIIYYPLRERVFSYV